MNTSLPGLIAQRFIQRRNVKAIQFDKAAGAFKPGDWFPDIKIDPAKRPNSPHLPHGFKMKNLIDHIEGRATYGHYLIDDNNKARMFTLDIDIEKVGSYCSLPDFATAPADADDVWLMENTQIFEFTDEQLKEQGGDGMRDAWHDRRNTIARTWYKMQMKTIAHRFASIITKDLQLPCAVAYSGNKGVHVYGFLGETDAKECRDAALLTLELSGEWAPHRGKNFYKHKNPDPMMGFPSFSVETFPKQDTLDDKDLGNLVRLPLGINHKNPKDPTFFLDMTGPLGEFKPHADPIQLLESGDPFQ